MYIYIYNAGITSQCVIELVLSSCQAKAWRRTGVKPLQLTNFVMLFSIGTNSVNSKLKCNNFRACGVVSTNRHREIGLIAWLYSKFWVQATCVVCMVYHMLQLQFMSIMDPANKWHEMPSNTSFTRVVGIALSQCRSYLTDWRWSKLMKNSHHVRNGNSAPGVKWFQVHFTRLIGYPNVG